MNGLAAGAAILAGYVGLSSLLEKQERQDSYDRARAYCDRVGKPLLNIGCPSTRPFAYPCGDVCLEIAAVRLKKCRSRLPVLGDVRDLSRFGGKAFGAVTCFHVLEHLETVADARRAVGEMVRVADQVYICVPRRSQLIAWVHPDHHLWLDPIPGGYRVSQRHRGEEHGEVTYGATRQVWATFEAALSAANGDSFSNVRESELRIIDSP